MRKWLLLLAAIFAAPASASINVLFSLVDDLRPTLGAYGDAHALTPNIDALASDGFLFTNAFANVPVCGASRASLLSGLRPTAERFLTFNSRLDQDAPDAPSLPGWFKQHGYHTLANGKLFDVEVDSAESWSEPLWNPGQEWHSPVERKLRHEDLQKAYVEPLAGQLGPPVEAGDVDDDGYPDGRILTKSVADIRRLAKSDQPFFLGVGFRKPHLPFAAPKKYWQMYSRDRFKLPSTYTLTGGFPRAALHHSPELRFQYAGVTSGLLPESEAQELLHGYYASVSYIDALIGKLVQSLTEAGIADKTAIVLVGDHGWNLGEHTLWTKHSLFDVTLKVPMMLRVPAGAEYLTGQSHEVVELVDVFPTIATAAGLELPPGLQGCDVGPLLMGQAPATGCAESHSRWLHGESVRTGTHRYTQWRNADGSVSAEMLFDVANDPEETRNLANDKKAVTTLAEMRGRLERYVPANPSEELIANAKRLMNMRPTN